jgi:hypothetical protein
MRLTERVSEAKASIQEDKLMFTNPKDHKKEIESLHTVLAKFKDSKLI